MARVSRSSVVAVVTVLALLAALPGSIHKLIQTGNIYLFSHQFLLDMHARLSGPGRLRFIVQPSVAIVLGARDGIKDAKAGAHPFLLDLIYHSKHRWQLVRGAFASVGELIGFAIILDLISQFLIFRNVNPTAALVLGPVLIATPYALSRAWSNRITRRRNRRRPELRRAA